MIMRRQSKDEIFYRLIAASNGELDFIFRHGIMPNLETMLGYEFDGYNTAAIAVLIGRKFIKGFRLEHGIPKGYNLKAEQNGVIEPWIPKGGAFGFFDIYPAKDDKRFNRYQNALLFNYGTDGRNGLFTGKGLRDYVVQPYHENSDVLLGKAYMVLGPFAPFVSWFVLRKRNKNDKGCCNGSCGFCGKAPR